MTASASPMYLGSRSIRDHAPEPSAAYLSSIMSGVERRALGLSFIQFLVFGGHLSGRTRRFATCEDLFDSCDMYVCSDVGDGLVGSVVKYGTDSEAGK